MKISRTPLRFSLIGGGSDLPEYWQNYGPCQIISMTLAASMYVTLTDRSLYGGLAKGTKSTYGNKIRLSYTSTENVDSIDDIQHELIRESLKFVQEGVVPKAFEMTTVGDIPSRGAGLGSSSALIVGILRFFNWSDPRFLAMVAAEVEIMRLGKQIGWQDHLSAAYGGLRRYVITPDYEGFVWQDSLDIANQGAKLAEKLLAFRLPVNRSDEAASGSTHETLLDMQRHMQERAYYLTKTVELVKPMSEAISTVYVPEVARILKEAWELKKASHNYVDKNIERWYDMGMKAGALAGKVSGSMSKGAGHLFLLAYPDDHVAIRETLGAELAEMKVEFYPHGSKVWEI